MATTPNVSSFTLGQMTDLIERSFNDSLKSLPQIMRNAPFVMEDTMSTGTGLFRRYAENVHRNQYARYRAEGDVAQQAAFQYGYEKDLAVKTQSLSIGITKLMRVGGKNQEILRMITDLSESVPLSIDLDLSHRITFAYSTSYVDRDGITVDVTTGDGLALASASHTLTWSATTYSTIITSNPVFSKNALETAEKSFVEGTFNNLGEKVAASPEIILTTDDPATMNAVKELLFATANTASSNSGTVNVYRNKYEHVVAPRIATTANGGVDTNKSKYWALVCSELSDFYFTVLQEAQLQIPTKGNNGEDIASGNWTYVADAIYGMCIVTARAWRFSNGSGS